MHDASTLNISPLAGLPGDPFPIVVLRIPHTTQGIEHQTQHMLVASKYHSSVSSSPHFRLSLYSRQGVDSIHRNRIPSMHHYLILKGLSEHTSHCQGTLIWTLATFNVATRMRSAYEPQAFRFTGQSLRMCPSFPQPKHFLPSGSFSFEERPKGNPLTLPLCLGYSFLV